MGCNLHPEGAQAHHVSPSNALAMQRVKEKADYALDYAGLDGLLTLFPDSSSSSSRLGSGK